MFTPIDYQNWDRKDIYEIYAGFSYTINVDLDMTNLYHFMKENHLKFYPLICWIIGKVANRNPDFRLCLKDDVVGYYDKLNVCYTLRRKAKPHLFTHMITEFDDDLMTFYKRFEEDKEKSENEDRLYYYEDGQHQDSIDVSCTPTLSIKSLSLSVPDGFYRKDPKNMRYTPFILAGKFYKDGDRVMVPMMGNFHHEVNDGYHAELFFNWMQEEMDEIGKH